MPQVTSKAPTAPQEAPKPQEAKKSFSEVTTLEKISYIFKSLKAKFSHGSPPPTVNGWNLERVKLQNIKSLEKTTKWGISALTALRIATFLVAAALVVGVVFAAPLLALLGMGSLTIIGISFQLLLLTALLYNLMLLMKTPQDEDYVYFADIDQIMNEYFKKIEDQRTAEQVQTLSSRNEFDRRKANRGTVEMEPMNGPPQHLIPAAPSAITSNPVSTLPTATAHQGPYAPISPENLETPVDRETPVDLNLTSATA